MSTKKLLPTLLLCANEDEAVAFSQAAIFNSAGYPVISAISLPEIRSHIESTGFDIAVLNHTLSLADRRDVARQIKERDPGCGVLVLHASGSLDNPWVDLAVDSRRSADSIFKALKRVQHMRELGATHPDFNKDPIVVVDVDRNYVFVSDLACRLLGYERAQFLELRIDDVVAGSTPVARPLFERYVADGELTGAIILRHRSGQLITVNYRATVEPDGCLVARWQPLDPSSIPKV